ncbi:RNA degradosome polyphosphate kinase [Mucilaginibacter gynuensis]|uniref:Polyphosphate kinase n=1 Tax=Mucilaginibacter gynuensis TaxID=1302236 RepID=A0ABP8FM53_9SPHI
MVKPKNIFNDRDLSWLSFNDRVLAEAERDTVPLLERIKFLSIFSSNLDEFYRVRMPVLSALQKIKSDEYGNANNLQKARQFIKQQQERFGKVFTSTIIPQLKANGIKVFYNTEIPEGLKQTITNYFYSDVLAFLQPVFFKDDSIGFFPENNKLYFLVTLNNPDSENQQAIVNIPSDKLPRFFSTEFEGEKAVLFLDDIIKNNLNILFPKHTLTGCYSFKITRDAELDLKDEYPGDVAEEVEKQLNKRDQGLATRFLYQPDIPLKDLHLLISQLGLMDAVTVEGGRYHNLKDLIDFPAKIPALSYQSWPAILWPSVPQQSLLEYLDDHDVLLNVPYQSYHNILRFFSEAANNPDVEEIYITLYRVAKESKIVNALISAAKNGKKVTVMIELKARFDEANNIKWARKMKDAGVKIIYSITALKVHAKVALVKRRSENRIKYTGLLATGNFNESTASFYTDHILMTSNPELTREMELLLIFLTKRTKPSSADQIVFKNLLVSQFNLQWRFLELIDREINNARNGKPASIIIKMNNLEEQVLISKLYEASQAGVKILLIVRGICCLVPGVEGMSEHITVRRIVDRYLEHGRVFIFNNDGQTDVYLGSADWMNRNIYRRIEVCFPVYDAGIRQEITELIDLQLQDNVQAVMLDQHLNNNPVPQAEPAIQSQYAIYGKLKNKNA